MNVLGSPDPDFMREEEITLFSDSVGKWIDEHAPLEASAEWAGLPPPGEGSDSLRALGGSQATAQTNHVHLVEATLQLARQPGDTRD